ncbi:hypothetical protein JZ785_11230 [Alicyclobacillus curvatus]|nr:hypothetical protein JZ785_11230 [Alicyclobacillus curvatus]
MALKCGIEGRASNYQSQSAARVKLDLLRELKGLAGGLSFAERVAVQLRGRGPQRKTLTGGVLQLKT